MFYLPCFAPHTKQLTSDLLRSTFIISTTPQSHPHPHTKDRPFCAGVGTLHDLRPKAGGQTPARTATTGGTTPSVAVLRFVAAYYRRPGDRRGGFLPSSGPSAPIHPHPPPQEFGSLVAPGPRPRGAADARAPGSCRRDPMGYARRPDRRFLRVVQMQADSPGPDTRAMATVVVRIAASSALARAASAVAHRQAPS